jgi:hypothetical protein
VVFCLERDGEECEEVLRADGRQALVVADEQAARVRGVGEVGTGENASPPSQGEQDVAGK